MTTEDLSLALSLLNCPIGFDILRKLPGVPDGPGLVAYRPLLQILLRSNSKPSNITIKPSDVKTNDLYAGKDASKGMKDSLKTAIKQSNPSDSNSSLHRLLHVIRKAMASFLINDAQV